VVTGNETINRIHLMNAMMKLTFALATLSTALVLTPAGRAASSTGTPFYGDPPDQHHPWAIHDQNRPQPKLVTPGTFSSPAQPGQPPSDAIVLFNGKDLSNWESDKGQPTQWIVKDGAMECVPKSGYIRTKQQFGDCQLHIEWAAPREVKGDSQGRGNSGIFLLGVEIQVLDNFDNPSYADGMACSVYGVTPPMANALRPPGEFQVVDIVFRRPIYKDGKPLDPGHVTIFCNGVLMQDCTQLEGETGHKTRTVSGPLPEKGPLRLQDHGNPVRYRNIWYRELPPRAVEGGTDGPLTVEATMAKRKELAAAIRADAAKLKNSTDLVPEMLRLAESLGYEKDEPTVQKVEQMAGRYAANLRQLPASQITAKKDEIVRVRDAFVFLVKFNILPATFGPKVELESFVKAQGWDKGKKKK
jgi:hypothetical protein